MEIAWVICGPRYAFQYMTVQKMWHTDQRKRESGMTTVFLHDFLRIHIPVISKSFIFNNKRSMENTLVLLNNTQIGELSPSQK